MKRIKAVVTNTNFISGLSMIIIASLVYFGLEGLKPAARSLPLLMIYSMIFLGLILLIQTVLTLFRNGSSEDEHLSFGRVEFLNGAAMFGIMILSYLAIPFLGFYCSVWLMMISGYLLYIKSLKPGELLRSFILGTAVSIFLYLMFHELMSLRTPSGFLV